MLGFMASLPATQWFPLCPEMRVVYSVELLDKKAYRRKHFRLSMLNKVLSYYEIKRNLPLKMFFSDKSKYKQANKQELNPLKYKVICRLKNKTDSEVSLLLAFHSLKSVVKITGSLVLFLHFLFINRDFSTKTQCSFSSFYNLVKLICVPVQFLVCKVFFPLRIFQKD